MRVAYVAAVTKSGTDSFHGDLYEFLRNTVLDGNNFFLNEEKARRGRPTTAINLAPPLEVR